MQALSNGRDPYTQLVMSEAAGFSELWGVRPTYMLCPRMEAWLDHNPLNMLRRPQKDLLEKIAIVEDLRAEIPKGCLKLGCLLRVLLIQTQHQGHTLSGKGYVYKGAECDSVY